MFTVAHAKGGHENKQGFVTVTLQTPAPKISRGKKFTCVLLIELSSTRTNKVAEFHGLEKVCEGLCAESLIWECGCVIESTYLYICSLLT